MAKPLWANHVRPWTWRPRFKRVLSKNSKKKLVGHKAQRTSDVSKELLKVRAGLLMFFRHQRTRQARILILNNRPPTKREVLPLRNIIRRISQHQINTVIRQSFKVFYAIHTLNRVKLHTRQKVAIIEVSNSEKVIQENDLFYENLGNASALLFFPCLLDQH